MLAGYIVWHKYNIADIINKFGINQCDQKFELSINEFVNTIEAKPKRGYVISYLDIPKNAIIQTKPHFF